MIYHFKAFETRFLMVSLTIRLYARNASYDKNQFCNVTKKVNDIKCHFFVASSKAYIHCKTTLAGLFGLHLRHMFLLGSQNSSVGARIVWKLPSIIS